MNLIAVKQLLFMAEEGSAVFFQFQVFRQRRPHMPIIRQPWYQRPCAMFLTLYSRRTQQQRTGSTIQIQPMAQAGMVIGGQVRQPLFGLHSCPV